MTSNEYINNALDMLRHSSLKVTKQRINMINLLFKNGAAHHTAEQIYSEVNKKRLKISLATIYNCLNQFTECGIVKIVKISSDKIFYDTNIKDHHHFFCKKSGELIDIKTNQVQISKLPKIPKGKVFQSVEVIVNITE